MATPGEAGPANVGESASRRPDGGRSAHPPAERAKGRRANGRTGRSASPDRTSLLLDIARSLGDARSPRELYRIIHRETARVLDAPAFFVSLYDPGTDLATVVYYADQGKERDARLTYPGSRSKAIRFGRPTLIRDRGNGRSLLLIGEDDRRAARSAVSAPMHHGGGVLGTLSVQSYRPGAFGREELELLSGIAGFAGTALATVRHMQDLERKREEAERLEELARTLASSLDSDFVLRNATDAALDLLQADEATAWVLHDDTVEVAESAGRLHHPLGRPLPVDGFVQRVLDGRPFLILDDVQGSSLPSDAFKRLLRPSSVAFAPLLAGERLMGMLSVGRERTGEFDRDAAALLRRLADQAAAALWNAQLYGEVEVLSMTDPLTGLPNRRHLQEHLQREVAAAERGRELSVVIFDLDNFKGYNDTQGHPAGDQVLRRVARLLAEETRTMNLVARYGGDEFISVLSDADSKGARLHAERIGERVADDPELARHGITVSFGTASFGGATRSAEDLLQKADRALFRRKDERRRVST